MYVRPTRVIRIGRSYLELLFSQLLFSQRLFSRHLSLQTLSFEHDDMNNQVEDVRDSAIDLMTKGDKYQRLVEPELTTLNQRWDEVSTKLTVSTHSLLLFHNLIP